MGEERPNIKSPKNNEPNVIKNAVDRFWNKTPPIKAIAPTGLKLGILSVIAGSILSAVIFFLVTNTGSWIALEYTKDFSGLMSSYAAGVPFFRATLVSQLLFSVGIYVLYNLATQRKTSVAW